MSQNALYTQTLTPSITQNIVLDPNNSSVSNLNVGNSYTFTGTHTSTSNVSGIQVTLFSDKNCSLTVQQSHDFINWDISDSYMAYANVGLGITVQAISLYCRIIATTQSLTTTVFRLETILCPIVEAVPRSLNEDGNFKVAVLSQEDEYGFSAENTPTGEQRTVQPVRLCGTTFEGAVIDNNFWTTAAAGTAATIAQANAQIIATSGTSNAAAVTMFSVRRARYLGGSSMRYRAVVRVGDTGTVNNKRRWGIAYGASMPTITDGAYFQLNGTTFGIRIMKTGTETPAFAIDSGSFNGKLGATYTPPTNVTTYEIYWTNSKVYFVIGDEVLHTISAASNTWSDTMHFHCFADSLNSGVLASSVILNTRSSTIYRLGNMLTLPTYKNISGNAATWNLKYGPGTLHKVIYNNVQGSSFTIYDSVTGAGNKIATVTTASNSLGSWDYNCPFFNGLTIVTVGNSLDATVIYE